MIGPPTEKNSWLWHRHTWDYNRISLLIEELAAAIKNLRCSKCFKLKTDYDRWAGAPAPNKPFKL